MILLAAAVMSGAALLFAQVQAAEPDQAALPLACGNGQELVSLELAGLLSQALGSDPSIAIAQQDVASAKADVLAAQGAFLPQGVASYQNQHYVPNNEFSPVIVVGNTVLGGSQTNSAYGSLALSLNLYNNGRDVATLKGAKAGERAAVSGLDSQVDDTFSKVLQAYADLYEAQVVARQHATAVEVLRTIQSRAEERYVGGHGSVIAIGQARDATLDAEQALNQSCRDAADKASALADAAGLRLSLRQRLQAVSALPAPGLDEMDRQDLQVILDSDTGIVARRQKVEAARDKLKAAERAYGPTVTVSVRKDWLGQSADDQWTANRQIQPYDYQIGVSFQQQLFPFATERAGVDRAQVEVRHAQAELDQARLDAEKKLRAALSARDEAEASWRSARNSLEEAQRILMLTESLYSAGRTDLDSVQHATLDRDKAQATVVTLSSRRTSAAWAALRALEPAQFTGTVLRQFGLSLKPVD